MNGTGSDLNLDTNLNNSNGLSPPSTFNTSILDLPLNQEEISDPSLSIATVADIASLKLMITGMWYNFCGNSYVRLLMNSFVLVLIN